MEHLDMSAVEAVNIGIEEAKREDAHVSYFQCGTVKKYVYSKYTPIKNAKEIIDFTDTNKETFWLICGIGLGYTAEEILRSAGKNTRIVIIEPSKKLFESQKAYIEDLLEDNRVSIFYGNNKKEYLKILKQQLPITNFKNIKVVQTTAYMETFSKYYLEVIRVMNDYIKKETIGYNTAAIYAEDNIKNIWKNKENIKNGYNIVGCFDCYKDVPAVVVSAGPSLSKNIEYLKDFKGIIFTGTRTLHQLMELGIRPDYLVCVDPTEKVYELMREYGKNDLDLITLDVASPSVLANNSGKQYILSGTSDFISNGLFNISLPSLPMEGSVSTLCTSSAYYMGCNPIMFIGQDLAYTNNEKHADKFMSMPIRQDAICYVESYDGKKIATSPTMKVFIRWFETFIEQHGQKCQFINCTEGGAKINGTTNAVFKEMVEKYNKTYTINDQPYKMLLTKEQKAKMDQKAEENLEQLRQVMKVSQLGVKLGEELLSEYQIFKGNRTSKIKSLVSRLNEQVDKKLQSVNVIVAQIFSREYIKLERTLEYKEPYDETEIKRNIRIVTKSVNLYKTLNDAIKDALDVFESLKEEKQ